MFRTPIKIDTPNYTINHEDNIFLVGSCFAENIYLRLKMLKFNSLLNPFGILYNPISISNGMEAIISPKEYVSDDLFFYNGLWHSYDHHGVFSNPNQEVVLQEINNAISNAHNFLKTASIIVITLGTANVFELNNTNQIVANCHKVPNHQFSRKRLSVKEVISSTAQWILKLNYLCDSQPKIIFTVSPIRHIRDGFIENQRSKSTLLLAISQLENQFSNIFYFPSYEILMDDLRDYRFYEKDMIHPNEVAIDYIWKHFSAILFDHKTKDLNRNIQQIMNGLGHRLLHPDTMESIQFKKQLKQKISHLEERHSFLKF